jgi:homopolymeric O-antigen transport system permease protein
MSGTLPAQAIVERESPAADARSPSAARVPLVLRPRRGWQSLDLRELWHHRELLWFLAVRDIKIRYKQTALGVMWAVIQPLVQMVVLAVVFGKFGGLAGTAPLAANGKPVPYGLLVLCALIPWQLFAGALAQAGNSLVSNQNLITKVYFPRLVIPLASALSSLVDSAIASLALIALMAWYGIAPGMALALLPLFVLLAIAAALAVGVGLSALNVEYRDVRHTIPFLTQVWMLASPVAYTIDQVPEGWRTIYGLNPLVGVAEGFRWALLGTAAPPGLLLLASALVTLGLLAGSLYYFRRVERSFADLV